MQKSKFQRMVIYGPSSGEIQKAWLESLKPTKRFKVKCKHYINRYSAVIGWLIAILSILFALSRVASGQVLISQVCYDPVDEKAEFVEVTNFNPFEVDISSYYLEDNSSSAFIETAVILPGGKSLVIVSYESEFRAEFDCTKQIYVLDAKIGNGLANSGDVVKLFDDSDTEVDAVSWEGNSDAFEPPCPAVSEGKVLLRIGGVDTDTLNDWVESTVSLTDGSLPVKDVPTHPVSVTWGFFKKLVMSK